MNVYAYEVAKPRGKWLVGRSEGQPDASWIEGHTGIDPDSVAEIKAGRYGAQPAWLIVIGPRPT